ncbi:MAG: hypothetical protein RR706_08805 [Muribaculaceae bacterium]
MKLKKLSLAGLLMSLLIATSCGNSKSTGDGGEGNDSSQNANEVIAPAPNWEYSTGVDEMESDSIYYATCTSTNGVELKRALNDELCKMDITIRYSDKQNEVLLVTNAGTLSGVATGQTVRVKFDDGKVEDVYCSGASSLNGKVIFVSKAKRFIEKLKVSKKVKIEAEFVMEGNGVFDFDTEGLKWNY